MSVSSAQCAQLRLDAPGVRLDYGSLATCSGRDASWCNSRMVARRGLRFTAAVRALVRAEDRGQAETRRRDLPRSVNEAG